MAPTRSSAVLCSLVRESRLSLGWSLLARRPLICRAWELGPSAPYCLGWSDRAGGGRDRAGIDCTSYCGRPLTKAPPEKRLSRCVIGSVVTLCFSKRSYALLYARPRPRARAARGQLRRAAPARRSGACVAPRPCVRRAGDDAAVGKVTHSPEQGPHTLPTVLCKAYTQGVTSYFHRPPRPPRRPPPHP